MVIIKFKCIHTMSTAYFPNLVCFFWVYCYICRLVQCTSYNPETINNVLYGPLEKICNADLDDTLIFSPTLSKHLHHIKWVLDTLQEYLLYVNPTKYKLGLIELEYLDHIITNGIVKPNPCKTEAIYKWDTPKHQK